MAESSDTRYTVAKLNNSNYQIWKFKVKMLLIREDTWKVVQGDTPDPVPDDWQRKDEKAQCTIPLTVEDNQLVQICNCTSAKDMWKQLKKVHERSNLSSKMYLRKKLYKMRLQDDQNMQEYISVVLRLVTQLRGVGEEVSDQQVATLLLCGLPDEYETLITALEARDEDELKLEYVKNKLVDAYKRKKDSEADSTESRTESAMYSGKIRPHSHMNNRHNRNKETRTCFFCKRQGRLKEGLCCMEGKNGAGTKVETQGKNAVTIPDSENGISHGCFTIGIGESTNEWFIDSGATTHMTNNLDFFEVIDQTKTDKISIANGTVIDAYGVGDGYLNCTLDDGIIHRIKVEKVLYAPILTGSLLSVKKLTSNGNTVEFTDNQCFIRKNEKLLAVGRLENRLYKFLCKHKTEMANVAQSEINHQNCIHTWQRRLGHRDPNAVKRIDKEGLATGIHIDECSVMIKSEHCVKEKATQKPYPESSTHHSRQPLDLIHSDVCDPIKTQTPGKNK